MSAGYKELGLFSVTIPNSGLTTLALIPVRAKRVMWFQLTIANFALVAFEIQVKLTVDGSFRRLFWTTPHFTSPQRPLIGTGTDLSLLVVAESGVLTGLECEGWYEVRIQAQSSNAAGSPMTLTGSAIY